MFFLTPSIRFPPSHLPDFLSCHFRHPAYDFVFLRDREFPLYAEVSPGPEKRFIASLTVAAIMPL